MSRDTIQTICNRLIAGIAVVSLPLAALSLLLLTIIFTVTITGRFLGYHVPASDDISVILLAGSFTLGFAYVMAKDDHLAVDLLTQRLEGRVGTIARFLILAFTILVVSLVLFGLWHMFATAIANRITMPSSLPIPRAIPIGVVLLGTAMFELVMILRFIERMAAGAYPHPVKVIEVE